MKSGKIDTTPGMNRLKLPLRPISAQQQRNKRKINKGLGRGIPEAFGNWHYRRQVTPA
jgi:hypothetical protein